MEPAAPRDAQAFFLPIGDLGSLEKDEYYLAEAMGQSLSEIELLTWSRRRRAVNDKYSLEKQRQAKQRGLNSPRRSMGRRR